MGFFHAGAISRVFVTTLPGIAAMRHLVTAALLIVGVIHLLPLAGVLGAERLNQLYGIDASEPNLAVLMRHRAVLFGLLGGFFVLAAFRQALQGWRCWRASSACCRFWRWPGARA